MQVMGTVSTYRALKEIRTEFDEQTAAVRDWAAENRELLQQDDSEQMVENHKYLRYLRSRPGDFADRSNNSE